MRRFDRPVRHTTDGGHDAGEEIGRSSHVCVLCYATFDEERDVCSDCGSTLVCPWEERGRHETLRSLSGHGRTE